MTPPKDNAMGLTSLRDLVTEVMRIRGMHPWASQHVGLSVLVEEVGEVARALNDGSPREHLRAEAIQVAAVAIRLAEGDGS